MARATARARFMVRVRVRRIRVRVKSTCNHVPCMPFSERRIGHTGHIAGLDFGISVVGAAG